MNERQIGRQSDGPASPAEDPSEVPIPMPGGGPSPSSKIKHISPPSMGGGGGEAPSKIRAFEQRMAGARHEDNWSRSPNVTGQGAIHVRSFHGKLTEEGLNFIDQQINEWLDAHPQYEVKLVTTAVGEWTAKTKEPNLIVQVWV